MCIRDSYRTINSLKTFLEASHFHQSLEDPTHHMISTESGMLATELQVMPVENSVSIESWWPEGPISQFPRSAKFQEKTIRFEIERKSSITSADKSFECEIRCIRFRNKRCSLVMIKDITNAKQVSRLRALDQYKDMQLASVTHELRTPLNCIIPMINEVIEDNSVPDEIKENSLKPSVHNARLLLSIVNDILDYSRAKKNKLKLNMVEFSLQEKIADIIKLFQPSCKRKGLELLVNYRTELPQMIYGDPNRLGQVLINMLSNALKFTSKGHIEVIIQQSTSKDGFISLKVRDTGIGIKSSQLHVLFTEFGKIEGEENSVLNPTGVGLGLMISNRIVYLLGSTDGIQVSSEYGQGSEISFEVPIKNQGNRFNTFDQIAVSYTHLTLPTIYSV
eukprot:TRINITY_DN10420_c0_g3_i1.p1 TRINITY_DN10420_c0_g3~~TRINITY_DN10420_c0_g3_i1.p1  ORF type:complete len:414 (-),score=53.05 TRINITY_DN10420_c0_g3_i1:38-1213(-)